jgi:hypothetical protein
VGLHQSTVEVGRHPVALVPVPGFTRLNPAVIGAIQSWRRFGLAYTATTRSKAISPGSGAFSFETAPAFRRFLAFLVRLPPVRPLP